MLYMSRDRLREGTAQPSATGGTLLSSRRHGRMGRPKVVAAIVMILTVSALAACDKNSPARDGRYATHDRGNNNRP